jgi:thiol-disulfide isomerase/thioredoxin
MIRKILALLISIVCMNCASSSPLQRINDPEITALPSENEVVLVNFWATWCEPCIKEVPILNRLHEKLPELKMVGVSLDALENEGAVKKFIRVHGITYPTYLRQGNQFEATMSKFDPNWTGGLPATFIFKGGKQIYSKLGPIQEEEILNVIDKSGI